MNTEFLNSFIVIAVLAFIITGVLPNTAHADTASATAFVTLTIRNQVPRINSIKLLPAEAYPDSTLSCDVDFFDEVKKDAAIYYKWRKNNQLLNIDSEILANIFDSGDIIECIAIVVDSAGSSSRQAIANIVISDVPASTKTTKTMLNIIGVNADTEKTVELQKQGITSVTGYAVSELNRQGLTTIYILILVVGMLVLINVNIFLRFVSRRKPLFNK